MIIRPEQASDIAAIHAVHASSFPSAAEARLVDLLRAAGRLQLSLLAEIEGRVVGHIAFSPVSVESTHQSVRSLGLGLAPLAVEKHQRRQGVAAALVRAGLEMCRNAGFGWAVVLGEPEYYSRFGFRAATRFGLSDEYGGGEAFQCVELIPEMLPVGAGLVRYAPEFTSLE